MRVPAIKLLLGASAVLAMLTAAQAAQAQDYQDAAYVHGHPVAPEAYDTQANPNYGFGPRVTPGPDDVVSGNRVIGRDPDPFIRGEILRHYDSGWPD